MIYPHVKRLGKECGNNMTESQEDYLKMISFLSDAGEVRVTDIATRLNVSKPSVVVRLNRLMKNRL
jgi:DtxR family Mn-dependent transcriptional regulator